MKSFVITSFSSAILCLVLFYRARLGGGGNLTELRAMLQRPWICHDGSVPLLLDISD